VAESTVNDLQDVEDAPSSYTSSTPGTQGAGTSIIAPAGATGRRKQAVARVRIAPGSGQWTVNGRTLAEYFPNKVHQQEVNDPFTLLELEGRFDVIARIHGGGPSGQAGALRLGIARALNEIDEEANRAGLKKAGLKKARKAPQYSKR